MASSVLARPPNPEILGEEMGDFNHNQDIVVDLLLDVSYAEAFTPLFIAPRSTLLHSGTENPWGHLDYIDSLSRNSTLSFETYPITNSSINNLDNKDASININSSNNKDTDEIFLPNIARSHGTGHLPQDKRELNSLLAHAAIQNSSNPSAHPATGSSRASHRSVSSRFPLTESNVPSPEHQAVIRKRKPRARKRSDAADDLEESKRNKFLQRNREAASKCRQKKKRWTHDLEDTKAVLVAQSSELHSEYDELLEKATKMKNLLLSHGNCNDSIIDGWIEGEARKYVEKSIIQRAHCMKHLTGFDADSLCLARSTNDEYSTSPSATSVISATSPDDMKHKHNGLYKKQGT